jgi:hypothetical protein
MAHRFMLWSFVKLGEGYPLHDERPTNDFVDESHIMANCHEHALGIRGQA